MDKLGSGAFATVHRAVWHNLPNTSQVEVAVKTLKNMASEQEKIKFLQEAAIMGQFDHPYIIQIFGIVVAKKEVRMYVHQSGTFCAHIKVEST